MREEHECISHDCGWRWSRQERAHMFEEAQEGGCAMQSDRGRKQGGTKRDERGIWKSLGGDKSKRYR